MTYERERMRPVSRLIHLMFLNANTAGNDRLWKLLGSMLGAFNRCLHSFTPTHTQHMGTFNFDCNVVNLNHDIVSFFFLYRKFYFPDFPLLPLSFSSFIVPNIWYQSTENSSGEMFFCAWMGLHSFAHFLLPLCSIMADACIFAVKSFILSMCFYCNGLFLYVGPAVNMKKRTTMCLSVSVCVYASVC